MIFLDSAHPSDARTAYQTQLVSGITTNPALLSQAGDDDASIISKLCDASTGWVFYQLDGPTPESRAATARSIQALRPGRVGLKIPCTRENLTLAAELIQEGATVGITAIFSAAQALLAAEIGAHYILPYVNRSTRLLGDGPGLVRQMRGIIDQSDAPTQIIAASIKSPEEAAETVLAGAHHLTLPLPVIEAMATHELSEQAIAEFLEARGRAR